MHLYLSDNSEDLSAELESQKSFKFSRTLLWKFMQAFNGKKWEKFNSEKVASLAYARIQGKAALVTHFQNSSLMNEDKRCRPILFHSEGQEIVDQVICLLIIRN